MQKIKCCIKIIFYFCFLYLFFLFSIFYSIKSLNDRKCPALSPPASQPAPPHLPDATAAVGPPQLAVAAHPVLAAGAGVAGGGVGEEAARPVVLAHARPHGAPVRLAELA